MPVDFDAPVAAQIAASRDQALIVADKISLGRNRRAYPCGNRNM
jgi:hypothetical protein